MLNGLQELRKALSVRPQEIKEEAERGRIPIGYFCNYVPEELIYAAGLIPLRLISGGDKESESSGGEYITPNSCSYAKSCIGYRASGKDPFFAQVNHVVESPACVQMEWVLESLERYFGVKIIPIGLPRKFCDDQALAYYLRELEDFQRQLEAIAGKKIDQEDLRQTIELYNSIRQRIRTIYGFLKDEHPPISWLEVLEIAQAGFVLDRRRYLELLDSILEELEQSKGGTKRKDERPRLLITGSILAAGDTKLLDLINELGINIVIDELCTGSRWFWSDVQDCSLQALGHRYLRKVPCATLPDARKTNNTRKDHLRNLIEQYRIEGVISYTLRFCDAYSFKIEDDRRWLGEMGIPLLHINSDYSSINLGQIRTRMEAFMELLQTTK